MEFIKEILGIKELEDRLETLENLLLHEKSKKNGFAVLKKHLQRPDKPIIYFNGEPIEQD